MISKIKSSVSRTILSLLGYKTNRKIVVIESDDWGTVRMASREAYDHFLAKGYPVDEDPYNKFDALESNIDLEQLCEVLNSVRDKNGNPAILTANNIVGNPDFKKIKDSGFNEYYYEPFTETLKRYPGRDRVMEIYRDAIDKKLILPQFHGREHLNIRRWMRDIKNAEHLQEAFKQNMFSVHWQRNNPYKLEYMDGFDCDAAEDIKKLAPVIDEGVALFNSIWGFESKSFIANCYIWRNELEHMLLKNNIKYLQGLPIQFVPKLGTPHKYNKKYHYMGQKNSNGQVYLIRNCFFEPSVYPDKDWVSECMGRIETAFKFKNPAIISSHRLNFIGSVHPENTQKNLPLLKELLQKIVKKWPDVEFMSSAQLGDVISNTEQK